MLKIAASRSTQACTSRASTISLMEWMYRQGIEMHPAGTPSRAIWMAAVSVPPAASTSSWYGMRAFLGPLNHQRPQARVGDDGRVLDLDGRAFAQRHRHRRRLGDIAGACHIQRNADVGVHRIRRRARAADAHLFLHAEHGVDVMRRLLELAQRGDGHRASDAVVHALGDPAGRLAPQASPAARPCRPPSPAPTPRQPRRRR